MSQPQHPFDPYHSWLGISREEQPPHYYRLLGLRPLEANAEVIAAAADRQMAYVKSFHAGKYAAFSQQILNELATARVCLLNAASKKQYDAQLHQQSRERPMPAFAPSASSPIPPSGSSRATPPGAIAAVVPIPVGQPAQPAGSPLHYEGEHLGGGHYAAVPATRPTPPPRPQAGGLPATYGPHAVAVYNEHESRRAAWMWPVAAVLGACVIFLLLCVLGFLLMRGPRTVIVQAPADNVDGSRAGGSALDANALAVAPGQSSDNSHGTSGDASAAPPVTVVVNGANSADTNAATNPPTVPPVQQSTSESSGTGNAPSQNGPSTGGGSGQPAGSGPSGAAGNPPSDKGDDDKSNDKPSGDGGDVNRELPFTTTTQYSFVLGDSAAGSDVARIAVPDAFAQAQARQLMVDIFDTDYANAKSTATRLALAQRILQQGVDLKDDPAGRFVLLNAARNLAIEAGDPVLALMAIDQMRRYYILDPMDLKAEALSAVGKTSYTSATGKSLAEAALAAANEAAALERYEVAQPLMDVALVAARKADARELVKNIVSRSKEINAEAAAFAGYTQARTALRQSPTDAEANLIAGKYLALVKGDWNRGLPLLQLSNNAALRSLAAQDLERPTDAAAQIALADAWYAAAETADEADKVQLRQRAGHWYQQGLSELGGLAKTRVERRLADISTSETGLGPGLAIAPLSPALAKAFQENWARYLKSPLMETNSIGLKLQLLPAGEFLMGSPDSEKGHEPDESPQHRVRLTRPVYVSLHEVTVAQFFQFVSATGYRTDGERERRGGPPAFSPGKGKGKPKNQNDNDDDRPSGTWRNPGFAQDANSPVVHVSWNDAATFCQWLSQKEKVRYRLPTEAEWEFACRGGTQTAFPNGDNEVEVLDYAWFQQNAAGVPQLVGRRKPNPWGHYDMLGNVWEWCSDFYATYDAAPQTDPQGPDAGLYHVMRGGSVESPTPVRAAFRDYRPAEAHYGNLGFRIVREP
jgi:sulfatase modifying factor 1